ncbi:hypothetical protein GN956_G13477 [Arapaima gigas]
MDSKPPKRGFPEGHLSSGCRSRRWAPGTVVGTPVGCRAFAITHWLTPLGIMCSTGIVRGMKQDTANSLVPTPSTAVSAPGLYYSDTWALLLQQLDSTELLLLFPNI